jgi:hypothetical protein
MNLESYRSDATTVPWTAEVKGKIGVQQKPIADVIHSLLGRTMFMGGQGRYFDQRVVTTLSGDSLKTLSRDAMEIDMYLKGRSGVAPKDDDVLRVFSRVYHLWNPDDPTGMEARHAIMSAVEVLGLGKVLSAEQVFPGSKDATPPTPTKSRA